MLVLASSYEQDQSTHNKEPAPRTGTLTRTHKIQEKKQAESSTEVEATGVQLEPSHLHDIVVSIAIRVHIFTSTMSMAWAEMVCIADDRCAKIILLSENQENHSRIKCTVKRHDESRVRLVERTVTPVNADQLRSRRLNCKHHRSDHSKHARHVCGNPAITD
jgi:hypothetical protein